MTAISSSRFASRAQNYSIFAVLVLFCVFLSVTTPTFATLSNLQNILQQVAVVGVMTMGMTLLLVSGSFDLSVGGQVALVGIVAAKLANSAGLVVAIIAALLAGILLGLINGLIVTKLGVNSLVATLGSGLAFTGIAYLFSGNAPIVLASPELRTVMTTTLLGFPVPVYILLIVAGGTAWFLHGTVGGRRLYAVGANESAARYAGVMVDRVRIVPFAITGLYCAIGALILTGLLASAQPNVGANFPLQVIAAAVVGGVSVSGGRGTVGMAIIGILLIGVVSNGFNLMGLDSNFQNVFTGVILIVAVAVDSYLRKRSLRVAVRRLRTRRGLEPDPANLPATASD